MPKIALFFRKKKKKTLQQRWGLYPQTLLASSGWGSVPVSELFFSASFRKRTILALTRLIIVIKITKSV